MASEIVLVAGGASRAKVDEVEARLRFLLGHLDDDFSIRAVAQPVMRDYVGSAAVVTADSAALPKFGREHLCWVADLDYETNPHDGWALSYLGETLVPRKVRNQSQAAAREIFTKHVRALKSEGRRPAYVFGTGPSLQRAGERSFDDGFTVVCNTIVRDPELWHHLSPALFTAGDAIYHFGHNAHASQFRRDALQRLRESGGRTLFVYPAQFDAVVRSEFGDVRALLVPIAHGDHTDVTVDLLSNFTLPLMDNVLANSLLPLGCTLSNDVRMWGFDGRAPTDAGFWANSDRHAYPELMQSIRDAHPAFFEDKVPTGNEVKYVNKVHGELLDQRLTEAEQRGFSFEMLHRSWTPTLQKRFRDRQAD